MSIRSASVREPVGRIGQRRQIAIPQEIFKALNLQEGDFVAFARHGNGVLLKPRWLVDPDDVLTEAEAKRLRQSLQQMPQGKTRPWADLKHELGLEGMPNPPHTTVPGTLKAYYAQVTGDTTTHQRTVDAHFKNLQPRRQRIIMDRVAGDSLSTIAKREAITHGTVASDIKRGFEAMRKAIAGEPKYNKVGRARHPKEEGQAGEKRRAGGAPQNAPTN